MVVENDEHFPDLPRKGYRVTSEPSSRYNCFAYAAGDESRRWGPGPFPAGWQDDYWPEGAPHEDTLEAFMQAYGTVGFAPGQDGSPEPGVEEIAIYATREGPQHAARQEKDGTWRSKLGPDEDIEHALDGLVGPLYGKVVVYLARPRKASPELVPETPPPATPTD
jgi:hypothetical protein